MDSLTISPETLRLASQNSGSAVALESLQGAKEQADELQTEAQQKPPSSTGPGVGNNVDISL